MNAAIGLSHLSPSEGNTKTTTQKQKSAQGNTEIRPMGRFSKDTMESPYSARLPSSLFRRKNREDVRSSRNDRWAVSDFYPVCLAIGEPLRLDPSADSLAIGHECS